MVISSLKPSAELFVSPAAHPAERDHVQWYRNLVGSPTRVSLLPQQPRRRRVHDVHLPDASERLRPTASPASIFRARACSCSAALLSYLFPAVVLFISVYMIVNSLGLIDTHRRAHSLPLHPDIPVRAVDAEIVLRGDSARDRRSRPGSTARRSCAHSSPSSCRWRCRASSRSRSSSSCCPGTSSCSPACWSRPARMKTIPVGIAEFITSFDVRWGEIMAIGTLATVPVVDHVPVRAALLPERRLVGRGQGLGNRRAR